MATYEIKIARSGARFALSAARIKGTRRWLRGAKIPSEVYDYCFTSAEKRGVVDDEEAVKFLREEGKSRDEFVILAEGVASPRKPTLADTVEGKALVKSLDAYGHMEYCVGFGEEGDDRGDWLACADFAVGKVNGKLAVAYHIVVNSESGGFIDTLETDVVPVSKAPFGLLDYCRDIGYEQFSGDVTKAEDKENKRMSDKFDAALKRAIASAKKRSR